ncbi:MAG TPA: DNA primase [Micromonosporaceae bacterium]|nr:DNA primase [Micromonosporaceae bacterium]
MARQSPDRRNADDPDVLDDNLDSDVSVGDAAGEDEIEDDIEDGADEEERDPAIEALWADVRIDPVEIALPTGSGYTLRAYRPAAELAPAEIERDEEEDLFAARPGRPAGAEDDEDDDTEDDFADEFDESELEAADDASAEAGDDDAEPEDVPVFLGHRGKVFLFRTPESLVEFVRSNAPNDLAQLDTWAELVDRIRLDDITARDEDTYELDLVVENLRGGHDAWDPELLIGAGEIARDLAYALRMEAVLTALSAGSPLDDLDEALRTSVAGGLGGFFGRRRLRKIGAQQATLGWRTIVGKISGAVDWRD